MATYQYKREPLSNAEADNLANATKSFEEKLVIFTLLDTGLRVAELAGLTKDNIQWQERRLVIYGKGGIYGKKSKRRIVPMTERVRRVLEYHFGFEDTLGISARTIQRIVRRVANRAFITTLLKVTKDSEGEYRPEFVEDILRALLYESKTGAYSAEELNKLIS